MGRPPPARILSVIALLAANVFLLKHAMGYIRRRHKSGSRPSGGLFRQLKEETCAAGNLYGTAFVGGSGYGTAWVLKHKSSSYVLNVLHTSTGGADGANPLGQIVFGPSGILYGSTTAGANPACVFNGTLGCGTIFTLQPPATFCRTVLCPGILNVIHSFTGGADGWQPTGDLIFDAIPNTHSSCGSGPTRALTSSGAATSQT